MPLKLRVVLEGAPPLNPFQHAKGLRALALRWIAEADPGLAEEIHEANMPKPYTLSPLWSGEPGERGCWFEITVLVDDLAVKMLRGIEESERQVRLGGARFRIADLRVSAQASWDDLLTPPEKPVHEFGFRLCTPTAHHASGPYRKSVVSPSPELYYAGWLARWNLCCPLNIDPALLAWVEQQVAVKEFEGGTRMVHLDMNRSFIGYVGAVTFVVLKPETLPAEVGTMLAALSRYAVYCGTGVDTMRGMGQTTLTVLR